MSIHPTAVIGSNVQLGPGTVVGPYAIVEDGAKIGAGCVIGPHVVISGFTTMGDGNRIFAGASIGGQPQDKKYDGGTTYLNIGNRNVIREFCTINRAAIPGAATTIGDDNFIMATCHVGHDSRIGNHVIMANGATLGGHTHIGDRAFLSAMSAVHQFVRVGRIALISHASGAAKDVPPFVILRGYAQIRGLNLIGLRRAGISPATRASIKAEFDRLYRTGLNVSHFIQEDNGDLTPEAREFVEFVHAAHTSRRGLCRGPRPSRLRREATL